VRFILFSISSILILAITLFAKEPLRTWTSTDGRTLEARYLEMVGSKVRIENASGRKFTIPLTGFSSADQEYVKKAHERSLFAEPQPFEDKGKGGVIVASAKGKVEVLVAKTDRYSDPKPRAVIVGESIASGATLTTGSGAEADLLLTNGTLVHLGEDTKLVLTALYQKSFKGTKQKASELTKEVSPSRTALKLAEGDLVLEVRKLGKESSFLVETKIAQAGIRGTQFKVSASADSAELSVLEGRVDFLDSKKEQTSVETAQKAESKSGDPAKVGEMTASEQAEVKRGVDQSKKASASINLKRLADTVDGYSPKTNYIVKSALNMELIWCSPGSFIMGPDEKRKDSSPANTVILTQGFYLGKYEVTQQQYEKVMGRNPSAFRGQNLPVESVSWNDAVKFCDLLTTREMVKGWRFALPTEAQWEYACRAGTKSLFPWGNAKIPKMANDGGSGLKKPIMVGSFPPNPWGFYDMLGNVCEWTADLYSPYNRGVSMDPQGSSTGTKLIDRGGSWRGGAQTTNRGSPSPPDLRKNSIGFRVALSKMD
jgi:formylglycine-generating enzyme required for sulfatase activity